MDMFNESAKQSMSKLKKKMCNLIEVGVFYCDIAVLIRSMQIVN